MTFVGYTQTSILFFIRRQERDSLQAAKAKDFHPQ